MPLIAYQNAHGANDFPLHFSFFEALQKRGLLDQYNFAIDPFTDLPYCYQLLQKFPQLQLTTTASRVSWLREWVRSRFGRGSKTIATFEYKFDAVCEAPGGRIHPLYSGGRDIFWRYPNTKRTAILFHSIEEGVLRQPETRRSIIQSDLILARTSHSVEIARAAGVDNSRIIESSDIVLHRKQDAVEKQGIAVALRIPNLDVTVSYLNEIRDVMNYLETLGTRIDHVRMETPMGEEQIARGYGSAKKPHIGLWADDLLYVPFSSKRDAIISSRLHTTLLALLAGNRKILQFQIEPGTNKIAEILSDMGLTSLPVFSAADVNVRKIKSFLADDEVLDSWSVENALRGAEARVSNALDRLEEWLLEI